MNRLAAFLVTLSRQLFWMAAFGLILAALYVSLGRQLVPLVAEYRTELQERVRTALDMPVTVGRLEGRWEGLAPRLLAHDVLLGEGDSAMRLDRIAVVPDLAGSLWARSWRLSSLEFSGVHLSVIEGEDGKWQVKGLPERDDAPPPDPQKILEALQHIRGLALLDSQITLEPFGDSPLTLSYTDLSLRTDGNRLRLDGRSVLPDGQPLALRLNARVQPQRCGGAAVSEPAAKRLGRLAARPIDRRLATADGAAGGRALAALEGAAARACRAAVERAAAACRLCRAFAGPAGGSGGRRLRRPDRAGLSAAARPPGFRP